MLIIDEKGKNLTCSNFKKITNSIESMIEKSPEFSWIEKHVAFVALCLTAIGTVLNFYVYIYYFAYVLYWNMDISYIDINTTNTIFAFLVQVIVSVIFLYLAYLWVRKMYISILCRLLSLIGLLSPFAIILATSIIYFTRIFPTFIVPLEVRQIVVGLAALSSALFAFIFVGSEIYKSTKEYKIRKHLKNKDSNKSKTKNQKSIKNKPLPFKLLIILLFTTAYLGVISFLFACNNTSFDIVTESKSSTYAVLSHKDKNVYAIRCEIQNNNITLYPSIHKLIPSDNLVIQKQTFASVNKADFNSNAN